MLLQPHDGSGKGLQIKSSEHRSRSMIDRSWTGICPSCSTGRIYKRSLLPPPIPAPTSSKWILSQQQSRLKTTSPLFSVYLMHSRPLLHLVSLYRWLQNDHLRFSSFSIIVLTDFSTLTLACVVWSLGFLYWYEAVFLFQFGVVWNITPWFGLCFLCRLCRIDIMAAPQCSTEIN